jgi:hypothetical protein
MPISTRQTSLLAAEDWSKVYQSFKDADFQSYDFETIRKAMIDYLRLYYPEDFNDYIESSEYIALIDLIATLGQNLAYRNDLNTRENFIDTAERRESVLKLARLISYAPKRSNPASGLLKITELNSTEFLYDSNGLDLSNSRIIFNDGNNPNWQEQFNILLNASLSNSQKVGKPGSSTTIAGIQTDEYTIDTEANTLPIFPYTNVVNGIQERFEITSVTTQDNEFWQEIAPELDQDLNILYRNDNLGNSSNNTGYFMHFKQGTLNNVDFSITDAIPNRVVSINVSGINQTDVWLYEVADDGTETMWEQVLSVTGQNIAFNSLDKDERNIYQVTTNQDDSINIIFGDGVFANIPNGNYRVYYRVSNGRGYKITPSEMPLVTIPINYVSKTGRIETLTVTAALQYTVANASPQETLDNIKERAPQQYYTQNRMVNGEDYNIFPFTSFNNIIKNKAVNRSSSGISRFLDVVDTTGKFSSTNIFADDGLLYEEDVLDTFNFEATQSNDILELIQNTIEPLIGGQEMEHFYYANFTRYSSPPEGNNWVRSTASSNQSTGYFEDDSNFIVQVGSIVSNNNKFLTAGALIQVTAPTGFMFDTVNALRPLPTDRDLRKGERTSFYTSIVSVIGDGTSAGAGNQPDGTGPITLSDVVPTDAIVTEIIPFFTANLATTLEQEIISNIALFTDFGLRYEQDTQEWVTVAGADVDSTSDFSLDNAGNTSGANLDASWLINFVTDGQSYTIAYRGLRYIFESVLQTRFYFDPDLKVFDSRTGKTIFDQINLLQVNSKPDSTEALDRDVTLFIYDTIVDVDGYEDNRKIKVTFSDVDSDSILDNPNFFTTVVNPLVNSADKIVFFQKSTDADNFEILEPIDNKTVITSEQTRTEVNSVIGNYDDGQLFYATADETFWVLTVDSTGRSIAQSTDYVAKTGRQELYFQYTHNSPNNRRIDPSPNNIIDLFILTRQYEEDYKNWISDITGTVAQPSRPTSEELRIEFNALNETKMISDTLIFNSAKFKPLFGDEAATELQATFKVVKNPNLNISDSLVKSRLITALNTYFDINNWDFGETFYFTELSTYLHQELAPDVASVIIVSKDGTNEFGSLFQINSEPNEILTSAATVNEVEIISAITAAQLTSGA